MTLSQRCGENMALLQGLTLTSASVVVFAELDWTPGTLEQCEDRAHRIGQRDAVHVHYLVAAGSLDDWVWSALSKKVSEPNLPQSFQQYICIHVILKTFVGSRKARKLRCAIVMSFSNNNNNNNNERSSINVT